MKRRKAYSSFFGILIAILMSFPDLQAREIPVRRVDVLQKAIDKAGSGDTVVLHKGVYRLSQTLKIEGKTNLVIRGEGVCLSGGVRIPLWRLRRAKDIKTKGVRLLKLNRNPVGAIVPKGDPHLTGPSWSEFYADGVPMHLSEWPDTAYLPVDSVVTPGRGYIRPAEATAMASSLSVKIALLSGDIPNWAGSGAVSGSDGPASWCLSSTLGQIKPSKRAA